MKKLLKVLVTIMLAVAFVMPMAVVVYANDEFNTLTRHTSFTSVDNSNSVIKYATHYSATTDEWDDSLSFNSFYSNQINEKNNSVRRIIVRKANNDEITSEASDYNLATGDSIVIQSITGDNENPVYSDVKVYTFVLKGDVNKDGIVDAADHALVVGHVTGEQPITDPVAVEAIRPNLAKSTQINWDGSNDLPTTTTTYPLSLSFTPKETASYIKFVLQYPSFFTYSGFEKNTSMNNWSVTFTDNSASHELTITAYKENFDGASSTKQLATVNFSFVSSTASGTHDAFKVKSGVGVTNNGQEIEIEAPEEKTLTVGSVGVTAPTLNSKTDISISLNSVSGYQYYCSTSNTPPTASAEWRTATGSTVTFSSLQPETTYYFYYRRSSSDTIYSMNSSVTTNASSSLPGPQIEASTSSSITVAFGSFSYIYFSDSSIKPDLNSPWIDRNSQNGYISGVGSYTINQLEETVTFSGLSTGRYYITGRTSADVISAAKVWSPTPNISDTQISTTESTISLPYAAVYKYSLDGLNYVSATSSRNNMTNDGSIYIQRETVNGNPNVAVIHGLANKTSYMVYVRVYDGNDVASAAFSKTVTTGRSATATPPEIEIKGRSYIYIAVAYNKSLNYRINNSSWTASSFTTYPTENNMVNLGNYAYYFSSATDPTMIFFIKLKQDTQYKIDAKFTDDPSNTSNISTITTRTLACPHSYGEKVYVGNTLNYTQTCSICGDVKTGTDTPAHTHTYVTETVPSTCTTKGYTYQKCSGCGNVLEGSRVELPLAAHTEARRVKSHATCTTNGVTEIYCSVCGAHIRDEITEVATGHKYEVVTVPSTCKTHGHTVQMCSVCGAMLDGTWQDLPLLEHDAEWVVTIEPTATSEGERKLICNRCGDVLETEVIAKLISYIKNTNGTGTYEMSSDGSKALVSDAAKLAIADGDASVKIVYPNGVSIELDPAMTVAFLRNESYLSVKQLTSDAEASGNLAKAGFSTATNTVYEISIENAVVANGKATVTVKYTANENGGAITVYFVDAQGKKTKMTSHYENGKLTFETNHFSTYVVEQRKTKGASAGLVIAIIAIVAVLIATGGTFGYIVYTSKKTKRRNISF